jgi:predicted GNAT superfamily acetyltransferase
LQCLPDDPAKSSRDPTVTVGVVIRAPDCVGDLQRLASVFDEIWGTTCPVVRVELLRAVQHAGGYLSVADEDDRFVGGSFGFLGHHAGEPALHSHVTGVLPSVRHTGLGRALKLHQRAWAADQGLAWIVWTFDPLVRRNAWFNLSVLGARVDEYLVDFYGSIDDAVNANDETDRLLVAWPVRDASEVEPSDTTTAVPTPDDIVELRRVDPAAAAAWRRRLRSELGDRLASGGRVVGFSRAGEYLVAA